MSLADAYDAVMRSPRLAEVANRDFGDASKLDAAGACPRIVWVPTRDRIGPPDTLGNVPGVVEGKRVHATSIALRKCGCDVHLFMDVGPDGHRRMEWLINEFIVACHEELLSWSNFELGDLEWFPRDAISQQSIEVVIPLRVYVPVWKTTPAQIPSSVSTRLISRG